jgi:hypothetical protein
MLKKDATSWKEKQTNYQTIKDCHKKLPTLIIPSTGQRILQTDASDKF